MANHKNAMRSPVDAQDPNGYVGADYKDTPKPRPLRPGNAAEKSSWLDDPTDDDVYQNLINDDIGDNGFDFGFKARSKRESLTPSPPYVDTQQGDLLADRAHYHHSPERYNYHPAPDWNDDTTALPDVWVRAHPFGNNQKKDAHGEYFDRQTNFHDKELPQIPVTYYHNYTPDGEPVGDPISIGKTIARKYQSDGRWDKIRFDTKSMPPEIKERVAEALKTGKLRASPTVVPDFHSVDDRTGHIKNWLTGSIAVLDAKGDRQPASQFAIGIPAMKALFKAAQIDFPKSLEVKKMGTRKMKGASLKARLKAMFKALLDELPEDEIAEEQAETAEVQALEEATGEEKRKALFENSNPEESATVPYGLGGNYWTDKYNGITESGRYDGADRANVQKDVQPLAREEENIRAAEQAAAQGNALHDPDIRLDWERQEKAMKGMKAQLSTLQAKADHGDFNAWFIEQMQGGKVMPAEREDLQAGFLQALTDDRQYHPLMKSKQGQPVMRVRLFKKTIENRQPILGERQIDAQTMKALGWSAAGFDQANAETDWSPAEEKRLLALSPLGQQILQDEKRGK